jgi:hypothetical protein
MSDSERTSNFEEMISPHLEALLQFSLWLTKNGRDAIRLLRDELFTHLMGDDGSATIADQVRSSSTG